jgi:hypothetical protein
LLKKVIIVLIEIFLLSIVLVIGANIWYSNPERCKVCHEVSKNYESWKISSHSSISCDQCHREQGATGYITYKFRGIFRVFLHFSGMSPSEIKAKVVKERCLRCHTKIRKSFRVGSVANLSDTHSIHLNKGFHCTDCHEEAVHPERVMDPGMPTMVNCITCHESEGVSSTCQTCHLDVENHQRKIADSGGLPLEKQKDCGACHTLVNSYDNKIDHERAIANVGGWQGSSEVCAACHPQAAKDMAHTVHSQLKSPVSVKGINEDAGMITRYCSFCGTVAAINWAELVETKKGTVSTGCGKCHVGGNIGGDKFKGGSSGIDCLICHAKTYAMAKRTVREKEGVLQWATDNSPEAAASVGPTTSESCKRCHEEYMTNYRGTPFAEGTDSHAALGMRCTNCHTVKNHKIARGNQVADLWANDLPAVAHACIQCHIERRHKTAAINRHLKKLACESCHVHSAQGVVARDWTKAVFSDEKGYYVPQTEEVSETTPVFAWFNGDVENSTKPLGNILDSNSRIYPFKIVKTIVPYDPDQKKPLPLKLSVFYKTGDISASVQAAMDELGQTWSGKWQPFQVPEEGIYIQINHSVRSPGRDCKECHTDKGIMDFKALGYDEEMAGKLKQKVQ